MNGTERGRPAGASTARVRAVDVPEAAAHATPALGAELSAPRRRLLTWWLLSGAVLTFAMLMVGGITRLTQSGLSIVEWAPLMGVFPPVGEAQWQEAFDAYKRFPEYQQLRPDMTLAEYRSIFYWEYAHRLLARAIGVVFLVPFLLFWARGYLRRPLFLRLLLLFGLGALQGLMGWLMVASGLVDRPSVAHERLAAHLLLAFAIFGVCLWTAADLWPGLVVRGRAAWLWTRRTRAWLIVFGVLLVVQVTYGAFVAGLDAGLAFNTWPLMAGGWLPPGAWRLEPPLRNLLDNIATVQWLHRTLPALLLVMALGLLIAARRPVAGAGGRHRALAVALLVAILVQAGLGIATLLAFVPVLLAAMHQAMALLLFGVWLAWSHTLSRARLAA